VVRLTPIGIAFPVYNRPHYLAPVLEAWKTVRGIGDAYLEFHCEPGCDEAVSLCESADFATASVHVNAERLGHHQNVLKSMNGTFLKTDYAIQALDDFLPSADLLELHDWHRGRYRDDGTVLGLRSGTDRQQDGGLPAVWRTQLVGALTGFHRWKWDLVAAEWRNGAANWWQWINETWCMVAGWDILAPAVSRAEDIGETGSTPLPESWSIMKARSSFIADPPPQAYYEVLGKRERGLARYVEEFS
jgi:hypothetical protein